MKNLLALLLLVVTVSAVSAQDQEPPKDGVDLRVNNPQLVIEKGTSHNFEILMVRSVKAKRAKFETPRVVGPKAIEFTVEQSAYNSDLYTVNVNTANVDPGKFYYLVTAKPKGRHKAKGLSMSVEVTDGNSVASTN